MNAADTVPVPSATRRPDIIDDDLNPHPHAEHGRLRSPPTPHCSMISVRRNAHVTTVVPHDRADGLRERL